MGKLSAIQQFIRQLCIQMISTLSIQISLINLGSLYTPNKNRTLFLTRSLDRSVRYSIIHVFAHIQLFHKTSHVNTNVSQ